MNDIKWYNDREAEIVYQLTKEKLSKFVADMYPNHELSHMGINRDYDTEEVVIKLHLNPIGRIKVVGSEPWDDETHKRLK